MLDVRHVRIDAGGRIDGGDGEIVADGDWRNGGEFVAGGGSVAFVDGVSPAFFTGSTHFFDLHLLSSTGKRFVFEVGSTQFIAGLLQILGAAGAPLQIASAAPGQEAFFNLAGSGSQDITAIGMSDVHAVGQHLAPDETNQGGSGNALGWFGAGLPPPPRPTAVPTSGPGSLVLLMLGAMLVARRFLKRGRLLRAMEKR